MVNGLLGLTFAVGLVSSATLLATWIVLIKAVSIVSIVLLPLKYVRVMIPLMACASSLLLRIKYNSDNMSFFFQILNML